MISVQCRKSLWLIAVVLLSILIARAQEPSSLQPLSSGISAKNLRIAPGKLLAMGKNRIPVGALKVITYRLEEIQLPQPLEVDQRRSKVQIQNAIRLTVVLDHAGSDSYSIWINDEGYTAVPTNQNEITALIISTEGLENDANITVKRGSGCNIDARSTLPDRLSVPKRLRGNRPSADPENFVRGIRSLQAPGASNIVFELVTSVEFPVRNEVMVLQIGEREFVGDPYRPTRQTLRFSIPANEFARVKDGEVIKVKYGACSMGGVRFGRLDKNLLVRK